MKNIFILCSLLIVFGVTKSKAQELEILGQFISPYIGADSPAVQMYGETPFKKESQWGAWTFMWGQPTYNYLEVVVGPYKEIELENLYVQIGAGSGGEIYGEKTSFRYGGFVYMEKKSFSAEFYVENGPASSSGFWQRSYITYQANQNFAYGFYGQTESGIGARVIYTLAPDSSTPISLWMNLGHRGGILGLQLDM